VTFQSFYLPLPPCKKFACVARQVMLHKQQLPILSCYFLPGIMFPLICVVTYIWTDPFLKSLEPPVYTFGKVTSMTTQRFSDPVPWYYLETALTSIRLCLFSKFTFSCFFFLAWLPTSPSHQPSALSQLIITHYLLVPAVSRWELHQSIIHPKSNPSSRHWQHPHPKGYKRYP